MVPAAYRLATRPGCGKLRKYEQRVVRAFARRGTTGADRAGIGPESQDAGFLSQTQKDPRRLNSNHGDHGGKKGFGVRSGMVGTGGRCQASKGFSTGLA
jgi:hypothetical protein